MKRIAALLIFCAALVSCQGFLSSDKKHRNYDRVLILYSAAFNDISGALTRDQQELTDTGSGAWVPKWSSNTALLVISHIPRNGTVNTSTANPAILLISADDVNGAVHKDTIYRAPAGAVLTDKDVMRKMLEVVMDGFPSKHYGLIMASHATGWLPEGYYKKGLSSTISYISSKRRQGAAFHDGDFSVNDVSLYPVRTYGRTDGRDCIKEMELRDIAGAIPMHLDYLVFDACLMGGIEVAYELKDKADWIVASPAEVPSEGMDYTTVAKRLLKDGAPDLQGLCNDYYESYAPRGSSTSGATTALVNCSRLGALADVCGRLFTKYRTSLAAVNASAIQRYYRFNCHWFYDLRDILVSCDITDEETAELDAALAECIPFKKATEGFMTGNCGFRINRYCGISMYLPNMGAAELDEFYGDFAWNKATGLVE